MRQWLSVIAVAALSAAGCSTSHPAKQDQSTSAAAAASASSTKEVVSPKKTTAPADAGSQKTIECNNKSDKRTLAVRSKDKGCEFAYTKSGKESVLASGHSGFDYCLKVQEKLQAKLQAANFECK